VGDHARITPEIATPADIAVITALCAEGGWRPTSLTWQELEQRIARGEVALLQRDGQALASVAVTWTDQPCWGPKGEDGTAGYVHALVRDRARTAAGVGAQLLAWAEARIAAHGRPLARLDARTSGARLIRYHREHGYCPVGATTIPGYTPLTLFEKRLGGLGTA
jgi:GNAT superfamily N-acetyltransferase